MTTVTPIKIWFEEFFKLRDFPPLPSQIPYYYPAVDTVSGSMLMVAGPFQRHIISNAKIDVHHMDSVVATLGDDCLSKWGAYFFTDDETLALFLLQMKEIP